MIDAVLVPLLVAGLLGNGLRLRARVPPALPEEPRADADDSGWAWVTARAAALDDRTRQDAAAWAEAADVQMADLVPADLQVTAARDLLRAVDPRQYQQDRLATGHSAGAAMMVATALLKRAEISIPEDGEGADRATALDPADIMDLAWRIRPCADRRAAIVVAPALHAPVGGDLTRRRARLRASGVIVPVHVMLDAVPWAVTVLALVTGWQWGLAAVAAYCLQPYLIFTGTSMRPRGLHADALLRPLHVPYVWAVTAAGRWRSAADRQRDADFADASAHYKAALADGTTRFLEERRSDCPWCGSARLTVRLRSHDVVMHKPGVFTLEQCGDCGHIFQNPRLSPDGLDFYYRDAYDGLGARAAEQVFLLGMDSYRGRARLPQSFTAPRRWLDVGAGHAHFCAVASQAWPDTVFDGLDQGAGIEEARRRGWVATAYRGSFTDLASEIAGRYEIVSMHHYLEHTRDPLAELDAAALILPEGGYLQIELPDPQWRLAPFFGRYWIPWYQPQHQHMIPLGNLVRALEHRGLRPVRVERGAAHQASDAAVAVFLLMTRIAPDRTVTPWSPRPPIALSQAWRAAAWAAGLPVVLIGLLADKTVGRALARTWDRGNAYRVLARKEGHYGGD